MKNKGFTLVEVLAVIVLLGILSIFSVNAISKINNKQKEENYKNSISAILTGADNYYTDHIGSTSIPTVQNLIDGGYAEVDNDYLEKIGTTTEITKNYCRGSATKTYVSITVPENFKNSAGNKTYSTCGCLNQENNDRGTSLCGENGQ